MSQSLDTKSEVQSQTGPLGKAIEQLRRMRYFRRQYDQRRALFYRQYLGQRDQKNYPDNITPRSNTFVPYPLSNVETIVSRVMDAFFSFDPWFECNGRGPTDDGAADAMAMVLHDRLRRANFMPAFESLVRNICIYGHGGIKVDWDFDYDLITYAEPQYALTDQGQPIQQPIPGPPGPDGQPTMQFAPVILGYKPAQKPVPRMRPKFTSIDIYDLYVDPDGGIVAHLTERTWGQMKREFQVSMELAQANPGIKPIYTAQGMAELEKKLKAQKDPDSVVVRLAEVWDEFQDTQTVLTFGEDSESISWKDLRASYRAATYSPYKRSVYSGAPILLYEGENPFMHKKAPILCTNFIKLPNDVFGLGAIEIISDLTEGLNKFVNMIADNWNLGINRRYAYDTGADIDHEALNSFNVPGGKVGVSGDPSKVVMPLPFFTPQAGDYQVLEVYKGMIELASGVSDFYSKGIGSPSNNRTATGQSQVMNESNFRFKMFIRNLEIDILQPLLNMCATMVQQYFTDPIEVECTAQQPQIGKYLTITPEQLIGSVQFELIASNYSTSKIVRQRNLMSFVQLVMSSPYWNMYEGLQEIAKVLEIKNITKMLYNPQQVAQMQAQAQDQQIKMMMLEAALQTEGKARLAQSKPQPAHAGQGKGGGRPATHTLAKKIPGAGLTSHIRELAQGAGLNAMGLEGLGELGGA